LDQEDETLKYESATPSTNQLELENHPSTPQTKENINLWPNPKTQIEGTISYNPIESWAVLGIEKYEAPFFPRGPWLQGQCWS
jgi:hypothetical protein